MRRPLVVVLLLAPTIALGTPAEAAPGTPATVGPAITAWYDQSYPTATPTPPPLPPGVTGEDLYVAGSTVPVPGAITARAVGAIAAMSFTVPTGSTPASLVLPLTSTPSTATLGAKAPTGVTLEACPTTSAFRSGGEQPFDKAPTYDCSGRTSLSGLSADGKSVVFSDIARVARGRVLSFVIRPGTSGADRLVIAPPTAKALSLLDFDSAPTFTPAGTPQQSPLPPAAGPAPAAAPQAAPPVTLPLVGRPSPAAVAGPAVVASQPTVAAPQARPAAVAERVRDDSRARWLALAGLSLLLAAGGYLAGTDRRAAPLGQEWGFGRYRSLRDGQAPAL
jgi:hypothetical protein